METSTIACAKPSSNQTQKHS